MLIDDRYEEVFRELNEQKDHPRSLILITNGFIEAMVEELIDAKCKSGKKLNKDSRGYPHATKLLILNELGVIGDQLYGILKGFNGLRNDAAHEVPFQIEANDLQFLGELSSLVSISGYVSEWFQDPDNLYRSCMFLIGVLWNGDLDILVPRFIGMSVHVLHPDGESYSDGSPKDAQSWHEFLDLILGRLRLRREDYGKTWYLYSRDFSGKVPPAVVMDRARSLQDYGIRQRADFRIERLNPPKCAE